MTDEWTIHEDAREVKAICRMLCERVMELSAENERYREALEPFAALNQTIEKHQRVPAALSPWWEDLARADAALKGTDDAGT